MLLSFFLFLCALFAVMKGATMATTHAGKLAEMMHLSRYTVGFLVVALISILPETIIALNAAMTNEPAFGLGMLFGSNMADLTLIFALLIWISGRSLRVSGPILKHQIVYPFILLLPLILGFDGTLTRLEGAALILTGIIFSIVALKEDIRNTDIPKKDRAGMWNHVGNLFMSMIILLAGSHFTVEFATRIAEQLTVSPVLIAMLIVGLGTTMPEFFFALRSVKHHEDSLAIGDLLGTVLADATIVCGLIALVHPFSFSRTIIYVTGTFMVGAAFMLLHFMRTDKRLTKKESIWLLLFWLLFIGAELFFNR